MAIKLKKDNLQTEKYTYTWNRDQGDGTYTGKLDQIKLDKDEGYEVLYFIESLINKHDLKTIQDVHNIEDALHASSLSAVVMRNELTEKIEKELKLNS